MISLLADRVTGLYVHDLGSRLSRTCEGGESASIERGFEDCSACWCGLGSSVHCSQLYSLTRVTESLSFPFATLAHYHLPNRRSSRTARQRPALGEMSVAWVRRRPASDCRGTANFDRGLASINPGAFHGRSNESVSVSLSIVNKAAHSTAGAAASPLAELALTK
jgi:hypothetical protein